MNESSGYHISILGTAITYPTEEPALPSLELEPNLVPKNISVELEGEFPHGNTVGGGRSVLPFLVFNVQKPVFQG
jgi:hypothetical protein